MSKAEFQYDEAGSTFYYVLIAFYAVILLASTYFFFPFINKKEKRHFDEKRCQCKGCVIKRERLKANRPSKYTKEIIKIVVLVAAWALFIWLSQKVSTIESTHHEYDPYAILGLDTGANVDEVKKTYRDLSKKHHPDRGGDPIEFNKIAKAYQALTDKESRENWEQYGNPDGPTATTFGIALPKWLVSKEYGLWVLAFYGLVFMLVLPIVVGVWWYNSIKYTHDKVLRYTTSLFCQFIAKTPKMEIKRMLVMLTGAFEFWRLFNAEIVERESDEIALPKLMKRFQNLGAKKNERPYAIKARILAYSYLGRKDLESDDLETDQRYINSRVLRLIEEIVSCTQRVTLFSTVRVPPETVENALKLMPMFTQALWPKDSPLLQLPHIGDQNLRFIKRNKVRTCAQLARLDDVKRRQVLNLLDEYQYRDVLAVLSSMPRLQIETSFEVIGEEDKHEVTASCVVTLKVKLTRLGLLDKGDIPNDDDDHMNEIEENSDVEKPKQKGWQPKKQKGKSKKKPQNNEKSKPAAAQKVPASKSVQNVPEVTPKSEETQEDEDEESVSGDSEAEETNREGSGDESDMEEDWMKPEKPLFETKTRETHPVHAPFHPAEKFEWWWLTLTFKDNKKHRRLCAVVPCKTLIDTETIDMKFTAPEEKGIYLFTLGVHSDSYMDADYTVDMKLNVLEAKKAPPVKYEDSDDEDTHTEVSSDGEYTEDDE